MKKAKLRNLDYKVLSLSTIKAQFSNAEKKATEKLTGQLLGNGEGPPRNNQTRVIYADQI